MADKPKPDPAAPIQPDTIPVPGVAGLHAIDMLDRHRNTVMIIAVVVTLGICGSLVLRELNRQKRSEAAQAFSAAVGERSIEKLDAVIADHPDGPAAGNALLSKAELQLDQEKPEDAKATLLTFVEGYKKHPRHAQGLYALGILSQKNGDYDEANEYYDRALADDTAPEIGPLVLIRKGDIALAQAAALRKDGKAADADAKIDEARQSYEESITRPEFRPNPFIELAESRIALTEVGEVPVVPAPPKPEPEPIPEEKPAADKPTEAPAPSETPAAPKPAADKPTEAPAPAETPATPKPAADKPAEAPKPAAPAPAQESVN